MPANLILPPPHSRTMDNLKKLRKIIRDAPGLPGVYLFKDAAGGILYVGKAKNLRNRLMSYLQTDALEYRKRVMVFHAADVEYIVVGSETDAFILEKNLIKENQPHYNVSLKDGKTYPYIKITVKEPYPRVFVTRKPRNDGSKYFGPYTSVGSVRHLLSRLRSVFPFRHCVRMPSKVCLQYHLGRCSGPCEKDVPASEYAASISALISLFGGRGKSLYQELEKKMKKYAEELEFEKAAEMREQLEGLRQIVFMPDMEKYSMNTYDTIAQKSVGETKSLFLLSMKDGKVVFQESQVFESADDDALTSYIYLRYSGMPSVPPVIVAETGEDGPALSREFSAICGYSVSVRPPENDSERTMFKRAGENANFNLKKHFMTGLNGYFDDLEELTGLYGLESLDAFDISNYGSEQFVGSCIRLTRNGFDKRNYRHFNIAGESQDDFRMIGEIVWRRYKEGGLPGFILIDGGRIQVSFALASLRELGAETPLAGLAKKEERLIGADGVEIDLEGHGKARLLLMKARDEVHRFAITFNRNKKRKKMTSNPLEEMPGLGVKKAETLLRFFGTVEAVRAASVKDLLKVPGIGEATAYKITKFLKID